MTLILTRVTAGGVVMAADSALTESYGNYTRILNGAEKLLPHEPSCSCIGTWGGGVVPNPMPEGDPVPLQFVLQTFVDTARTIQSGDQLSAKLAEWLNDNYLPAKHFIGLEVASARAASGTHDCAVYRVMNAEQVDAPPGRFRRITIRHAARSTLTATGRSS